jgi:arsenate reductase (glutaredoxin)
MAGKRRDLLASARCRGSAFFMPDAMNVQIFGIKRSNETRAAERFFKERRVAIQMVDLHQRPMAPAEVRRFADRFGLGALLDTEGKSYVDAGLKYLRMSNADILARIGREPQLLRLPLVRAGNRLSIGRDEETWKEMAEALVR